MNLNALRGFRLPPVEHRYTVRDTMLYALGVGCGAPADDPQQLQFVFEHGLNTLPSQSCVLAHPGLWLSAPELEINWVKLLHGEQSFRVFRPLPVAGMVRGEFEITAVEDKGTEKGAVMHLAKRLFDHASNELLALVTSLYILRGDGGCGAFGTPPAPAKELPDGAPDITVDLQTLPQAALIYRLSGDMNPIHAHPDAAKKAGFPRPVLQGLCTLGLATRAIIQAVAGGNPNRLSGLSLRFSKPIFPGETLRTEMLHDGQSIRFRARALERDVVVLDRGTATLT